MGLNLTKTSIRSNAELAELKSAEEILVYTEELCATQFGVTEIPKPEEQPLDFASIKDPDALTDSMLGTLHMQYTGWASFYNGQLAKIRAAKEIAELNLSTLVAHAKLDLFKRPGLAKTEVPVHVAASSEVRKANLEVLKLQAMRLIIEAQYTAYDKQAAAISRLITLRTEDRAMHQRQNGVAGVKRPARPANWGSGGGRGG